MTAAAQNVRAVVAAAAARGVPPSKLLGAIGLDPQALIAGDARLPADAVFHAWRTAAELCGDPAFGLSVAERLPCDYVDDYGFALQASATLRGALARLVRFFALVNQRAALEVLEDGALARVRFAIHADVPLEAARHPAECMLAAVLKLARCATGTDVQPVAVAFRHAAPAEPSRHHRAFGVAPRFDQPQHELALHRDVLDAPHVAPDAALVTAAERHLHHRSGELPAIDSFIDRVRRVLGEELRLGEPTLARLAARLRMSERTVQRRLGASGTSMQALLDELRHQLSLRQLAEPTRSIAEISCALGFAEVRAFHRAFKRWTGRTPAAYRQSRAAS